jgi:hypothetical protein
LSIRKKISQRLDELDEMMGRQEHLNDPKLVTEKIESITKFWSALSEQEKEFSAAARMALKFKMEWK